MGKKLTPKQRKFVEAYCGEARGNGTEAARLAGYKGNDTTLRVVACENLAKPYIAEAVQSSADNDPLVRTREDLQQLWSTIAWDSDEGMAHRLKASELLGKSLGLFINRHEHSGPGGAPVGILVVPEREG